MKLYHGSNITIKQIDLSMCKPYKDFGKGFYLTEIKEQAEQMAKRTSAIYVKNGLCSLWLIVTEKLNNQHMILTS